MAKHGKKLELYELLAEKNSKGKYLFAKLEEKEFVPPPPVPAIKYKKKDKAKIVSNNIEKIENNEKISDNEKIEVIDTAINDNKKIEKIKDISEEIPEKINVIDSVNEINDDVYSIENNQDIIENSRKVKKIRAKSVNEIVFAVDTALMIFVAVVILLIVGSYLGYQRGQDEKISNLIPVNNNIENASLDTINLRFLEPRQKAVVIPPENDYTLLLRSEPINASDLKRVELELNVAINQAKKSLNEDIQGFIFKTKGEQPRYAIAVGVAKNRDDEKIVKLFNFFSKLQDVTVAREIAPYKACKIVQVKELGNILE